MAGMDRFDGDNVDRIDNHRIDCSGLTLSTRVPSLDRTQ